MDAHAHNIGSATHSSQQNWNGSWNPTEDAPATNHQLSPHDAPCQLPAQSPGWNATDNALHSGQLFGANLDRALVMNAANAKQHYTP